VAIRPILFGKIRYHRFEEVEVIKKLFNWAMLIVVAIGTLLVAEHMRLNYLGYCTETGQKVDDYPLIDELIFRKVIGAKPATLYTKLPKFGEQIAYDWSGGHPGAFKINREMILQYKNINELKAINVDCCSFTSTGLYGDTFWGPTLFERLILGYGKGYANVKYLVRYQDVAGTIKTGWQAESGRFDNCGRPNYIVLP
jgi:hypothetical protein